MAKAKLRKMLGDVNSPYIASLMRLIETQSKATIARWCLSTTRGSISCEFMKKPIPVMAARAPQWMPPRNG